MQVNWQSKMASKPIKIFVTSLGVPNPCHRKRICIELESDGTWDQVMSTIFKTIGCVEEEMKLWKMKVKEEGKKKEWVEFKSEDRKAKPLDVNELKAVKVCTYVQTSAFLLSIRIDTEVQRICKIVNW